MVNGNILINILKGGRGSGNFGHGGRPGKRGGSGKSRRPKMSNTTVDNEVRKDTPYRGNKNNNKIIEDIENFTDNIESNFRKVVSNLSERSSVNEDNVRNFIGKWNTAIDFRTKELIVKSVNEELGIGLSSYEKGQAAFSLRFNSKSEKVRNEVETNNKITRAMYEETQEKLKSLGVDHIIVYRGMKEGIGEVGEDVRYRSNSVESWTFDQDKANSFVSGGGVTIKSKIPANRILSYANTGAGTEDEMEVVVLGKGSSDLVLVTKVSDVDDSFF